MPDDAIRRYLEARKQYETAAAQLSKLIAVIQDVAGCLTNEPMNFMFTNAQGMPAEVSLSARAKTANANDWPSATQIQAALVTAHETKQSLSLAWQAVSPDDRSGMIPPPDRFVPTRRTGS